jgi:hypothetical protein
MNQAEQLEFVSINTETPQQVIQEQQQPEEQPKKKRGRPKKSETAAAPDQEVKREDPSSLFDKIKSEVEENEKYLNSQNVSSGNPVQSPIHEAASKVVDGYMLLTICDTFFPMIIKAFFKKAKGIKDSEIRLSKEQKEHMTPIADDVATGLLSFLDPVTLFFILTGALYFQNTTEAISKKEK